MINRDTNVRMNMILALQHEWLRNEEYELEQSYSQEPYSQTYPDEAADIRNPLSASSSSACISVDTRDVTPETPLQHPIGLDDCSQDLGNLRLSSEDMKSQWSLDTESVNICHGAADYFPSIPRMTPRIPYPPHPSKESDNNLTGMNPLRSAWMPRPSGGPLAPVSEDSDILTPGGKRKLRSSPPRAPSPVSEKSSSPLSSPPPLSEGTVRPEAGKKPASRQSPPERRTSIRIKARKSKAVASAAAEQTPPPVPISKVKRRRLTSTGNAARYSSPSTRARQRSSSAETTKSNPMRRARRS
ncbi:uncharacterized protein EI90DRAFT_1916776 [Cantharellus anzutake]|uniref:uncharacterized protein n=1 Tax=Cantharellus anzutake TaxID=1750568 RepID=UPI0019059EAA|nr:uncharacterized protein EI90DRAFT_1916776 [Cantharellus anzutake]KAF8326644.1 hypothetical protein EI90DRAFT_1916776 [Cantharellus anzutake]